MYDSLHGTIDVDCLATQIIHTPEFQRLHLIRQTGLAYRVFPSATHSRFTHSLGVYHLARQCVEHLFLLHGPEIVTERHRRLIPIAGLCHDLGHGPFSHLFERVVGNNWRHEVQSISLLERLPIPTVDLPFLGSCIHPSEQESHQWMFQIVANLCNGIDVDKLDYLNRDAIAFGLPAPLRIQHILQGMIIQEGEIRYHPSIVPDLLDVFYHRYRMHRYFYQHPDAVAIEHRVLRVMKSLPLGSFVYDVDKFVEELTDDYILRELLANDQEGIEVEVEREERWLYANIVGHIYGDQNPLDRVRMKDGSRLSEIGGMHATMILGLSHDRWVDL